MMLPSFPMFSGRRWFYLMWCAIFTGGCAAGYGSFPGDGSARPAHGVPEVFVVAASVADAEGKESCYSPMIDPRDQTRLRLVRSAGGRGDYEVPAGRYGVAEGELLRLECKTGRVIGVVKGSSK